MRRGEGEGSGEAAERRGVEGGLEAQDGALSWRGEGSTDCNVQRRYVLVLYSTYLSRYS